MLGVLVAPGVVEVAPGRLDAGVQSVVVVAGVVPDAPTVDVAPDVPATVPVDGAGVELVPAVLVPVVVHGTVEPVVVELFISAAPVVLEPVVAVPALEPVDELVVEVPVAVPAGDDCVAGVPDVLGPGVFGLGVVCVPAVFGPGVVVPTEVPAPVVVPVLPVVCVFVGLVVVVLGLLVVVDGLLDVVLGLLVVVPTLVPVPVWVLVVPEAPPLVLPVCANANAELSATARTIPPIRVRLIRSS